MKKQIDRLKKWWADLAKPLPLEVYPVWLPPKRTREKR